MKQLYDRRTSAFTEDGHKVLRHMEETLRPLVEKLIAEGFPVRDIGVLLTATVGSLISEKALANIMITFEED